MNFQDPARTAAPLDGGERVQPDGPLSGEVQRGGDDSEGPGVYLLFRKQQLVYVGRSRNPRKRIDVHRKNGRAFDYSLHVNCPARDVAWVERAMIAALNPPQNRLGVTEARAEVEAPPPPRVIIREVAAPAPQPDARELLSVAACAAAVNRLGLAPAVKEAVKTGELRSILKNPLYPDGINSRRLIERGDLDAWTERKIEERRTSGWKA